jgi:hypothetical protein
LYESDKDLGKPNHLGRNKGLWTTEQIKRYEANTPADERPARIYGKANAKSGKIYPDFCADVHVIGAPNCPYNGFDINSPTAKKANCFVAMDPHPKGYPAIQWWMLLENGDMICYNEWPTQAQLGGNYDEIRTSVICNHTPEVISRFIKVLDGTTYGLNMRARVMDPRLGKATEGTYGNKTDSLMAEFSKHGLIFELPVAERIEVLREVIRDKLRYEKSLPVNEYNKPKIYWMSHCMNSIRAIERHYWDTPDSGKSNETEAERYKDFVDTLRYLLSWLDGNGHRDVTKKKYKSELVLPESFEQMRDTSLS